MNNRKQLFLISIIIPVYNAALFLEEALNSTLNQSYRHLEIIIIDDGSTDGSDKICDRYAEKDERIHVLHQNNRGLSNARNKGLDLATGQMIVFLDADDAYSINYVEEMLDAMIDNCSDMVICKYSVHRTLSKMEWDDLSNGYPSISPGIYDRRSSLRALAEGSLNHSVWNKMYKRELWENIRFPEGKVYEDVATTFQIISRCKTVFVIEESLYLHRNRNDSISSTLSKSNIVDYIEAYSHFEHYIRVNIPDVFSEQQLQKCLYCRLKRMMGYSISILLQRDTYQKDLYCVLRKNLLEIGSNVDIKGCGSRTRICRWMICYCPWLTKVAYQIYSKIMV